MFLKRLRKHPWVLCLVAAVCLALGMYLCRLTDSSHGVETSYTTIPRSISEFIATTMPTGEDLIDGTWETSFPEPITEKGAPRYLRYLGFLCCFLGLIAGFVFVFLCPLEKPLLSPEGAALLLVLAYRSFIRLAFISALFLLLYALFFTAAVLASVRELWWWIRAGRVSPGWSLSHRLGLALSGKARRPERYLLFQALWAAATAGCGLLLSAAKYSPLYIVCSLFSCLLCLCALWKYGREMRHLLYQLDSFSAGQPVTILPGDFQETEAQLAALEEKHRQAIHTAVTSERFKVELIANVSHDLRTPLTAILGYGELLQKEPLSAQGEEQLRQLNQKAGYMKDLVDSLFELTKVSSGAAECKPERLDLIRLLEQTLGLFDDQLRNANLQVRRHYDTDSLMLVTDGARMHQVFANLLGNAIKYTLHGTRIHLEVRDGETECAVRMTNIAAYEMDFRPEEILQRFARGDKARSTQGSGLGLAIAQTYTESVGGHFQVAIDGDQFSAIVTLPKEITA